MDFNKIPRKVFESEEDLAQFREIAKNATIKELSEKYNISYGKMGMILRLNEVVPKPCSRARKYDVSHIDLEYVSTHSVAECCRYFNLPKYTILKYKKEKGISGKNHDITMWASSCNDGKIRTVYYNMLKRCYNPKASGYEYYGQRGIKVCDEWLNDCCNFYMWAKSTNYEAGLQLDRIDVNGNYEPANCRWVTPQENSYNKRNTRRVAYKGEVHTLIEWAEITGINKVILADRIFKYKWSVERALTQAPTESPNKR